MTNRGLPELNRSDQGLSSDSEEECSLLRKVAQRSAIKIAAVHHIEVSRKNFRASLRVSADISIALTALSRALRLGIAEDEGSRGGMSLDGRGCSR